ncbi:8530_t:CDS:2 [Rhizophagus irregularis]|nr:8530_t:CDS:2 [Rhizophagus irregularis]
MASGKNRLMAGRRRQKDEHVEDLWKNRLANEGCVETSGTAPHFLPLDSPLGCRKIVELI